MVSHKSIFLAFLVCVLVTAVTCWDDDDDDENEYNCIQGVPEDKPPGNCKAPLCRCMSRDNPLGISPNNIPQLVMLTFDDAVSEVNMKFYRELLINGTITKKTNPISNCRIGATFFVSHEYNNYQMVNELYRYGSEIATHSISHVSSTEQWKSSDQESWTDEFVGLRKIITKFAQIPESAITGFRAPFLQTAGDTTFRMLKQEKFVYDSSLPSRDTGRPIWPYTFDHGLPTDCMITPCPKEKQAGLWVVPMISYFRKDTPCSMADACTPAPITEDDTFNYFMENFNRHYTTNRAPFPVFLHEAWLKNPERRAGYLRFVSEIQRKNGVYLVTLQEVVNYMKAPKTLIAYKETRCVNNPIPSPCGEKGRMCSYKKTVLEGPRIMYVCQEDCPKRYPWLKNPEGIIQ